MQSKGADIPRRGGSETNGSTFALAGAAFALLLVPVASILLLLSPAKNPAPLPDGARGGAHGDLEDVGTLTVVESSTDPRPGMSRTPLSSLYALTGLATVDGNPMAFVVERTTGTRATIFPPAPQSDDGGKMVLLDVHPGAGGADATATVSLNGEVGVLQFEDGGGEVADPPPTQFVVPGGVERLQIYGEEP